MKISKIILFSMCMISLFGCLSNTGSDTTPELITRENYYITNQSELNLTVTYKVRGTGIDSTVVVPVDSTTKILESGGIGSSSTPSSSFARLIFFKLSGDSTTPLLTIEPIIDEHWNLTAGNNDEPAKYELVITDEDLN